MKPRQYLIHIGLFVLTVFSTLVAGALQKGIDIIARPDRIIEGYPFCISLLAILLTHELSHYFASRLNHTKATLPYFIPAPSIIGTFGAFIKMKSPIINRRALVDIGSSGPIAGFLVALVVTIYGLSNSQIVSLKDTGGGLILGDSILFSLLSKAIVGTPPEGKDIMLNQVAFAGWIGFFVTSMNLLPIGQLDGGHVAYALFGPKRHKKLSVVLTVVLASAGILRILLYNSSIDHTSLSVFKDYLWEGWLVWAFLLYMLGLSHPPVIYWEVPLSRGRLIMGWLSILIFILTFTPAPFRVY